MDKTVERGSQVYTDEYPVYNILTRMCYNHSRVLHSHNIYVIGNVHTNTIKGFWSLCKNGVHGVFHSVSPNYLQAYLNEYAFRYNHRDDKTPMFFTFLGQVGLEPGVSLFSKIPEIPRA